MPTSQEKPEQFGDYTLLKLLGRGGMAEVFLAQARAAGGFEKLVAIKRLLPAFSRDKQITSMLADEARLSVWLTHPNTVQVLDFGRVGRTYYIAMEFVDGCDLCDLVRQGRRKVGRPLPLPTALFVMSQVAEALDFAHRRCTPDGRHLGIIHRDVSPHNVMISLDGHVKLADFGLARASISVHHSHAGVIRGKFSYMPKEQAHGRSIDHRIDLFAAGVTLYEALTGVKSYTSTTLAQQLYQLEQPIPPPSAHVADIPEEIDDLTMQAMCPEPERRYQTARDFADDLKNALVKFSSYGQEQRQLSALVKDLRQHDAQPQRPALPPMSLSDFEVGRESLIKDELNIVRHHERRPPSNMRVGEIEQLPPTRNDLPSQSPPELPQSDSDATAEFALSQLAQRDARQHAAPSLDADDDSDVGGRTLAYEPSSAENAPSLPPSALANARFREPAAEPVAERHLANEPPPSLPPAPLTPPNQRAAQGPPHGPGDDSTPPAAPDYMRAADPSPPAYEASYPETERDVHSAYAVAAAQAMVAASDGIVARAQYRPIVPDTARAAVDPAEDPEDDATEIDDLRTAMRTPEDALESFRRVLDQRDAELRELRARRSNRVLYAYAAGIAVVALLAGMALGGMMCGPPAQPALAIGADCPSLPPCPACPSVAPAHKPASGTGAASPAPQDKIPRAGASLDAGTPARGTSATADVGPEPSSARAPRESSAKPGTVETKRENAALAPHDDSGEARGAVKVAARHDKPRRPGHVSPQRRAKATDDAPQVFDPNRGFLAVTADGPAKAYIDDRDYPAAVPSTRIALSAGIHRVRVEFTETGNTSRTQWVTIAPGKVSQVHFPSE